MPASTQSHTVIYHLLTTYPSIQLVALECDSPSSLKNISARRQLTLLKAFKRHKLSSFKVLNSKYNLLKRCRGSINLRNRLFITLPLLVLKSSGFSVCLTGLIYSSLFSFVLCRVSRNLKTKDQGQHLPDSRIRNASLYFVPALSDVTQVFN